MNIGIIGTGQVARTLADRWAGAEHSVMFGSRNPGANHLDQPVATVEDTVRQADTLVNATPGSVSVEALSAADTAGYEGKVLIDVANAVTAAFELVYPNSSLGEKIQEALPGANVVKTMNTAAMTVMTEPALLGPSSVFLSGDDADAKHTVAVLLRNFGWSDDSIVDLGGIQSARGPEHYFMLFAGLMRSQGGLFNIKVVN